jgi:tetratricopeptide (TPR) repeat protein
MLRTFIALLVVLFLHNDAGAFQSACPVCIADDCPAEFRQLGQEQFVDLNYETAVELFTCSIVEDSASPDVYVNRAFAYIQLNEYDLAMQDAAQAANLDASWEWFLQFVMAQRSYHEGDVDDAIRLLDSAIELQPAIPALYLYLSIYQTEKRNFELATTVATQAIELDGNAYLYYLARAYAYDKLGDSHLALADINSALEIEPRLVLVLQEGIQRNLDLRRYSDALYGTFYILLILKYDPTQLSNIN